MKKYLLIILFLFSHVIISQNVFEKGYFIDNLGEKKECNIKNVDWRYNPTSFEYKYDLKNETPILAEINTISEFEIYGKAKFVRFKLKFDRSKNDVNNLQIERNPQWKDETLFLKILIEGKATLYSYYENNLYKYFFSTEGSNPEQLVYIKYLTDNDGFAENSYYKYQLETKLKSSKIKSKDIQSLRYEKKILEKIFLKYNESENANVIVYQKENKDDLNLRLNAGINLTSLDITDPSSGLNVSTKISQKITYSLGLELEYHLPYNNGKWSLFVNPSYSKYENQKSYYGPNSITDFNNDLLYETKVDISNIEIPIGFRYYFLLNKNSKLFLSTAFVSNVGKTKFVFNRRGEFESSIRSNLLFGLGYSFSNKYTLEYRIQTPKQLLGDYFLWSSKYFSQGIVIGYNFL